MLPSVVLTHVNGAQLAARLPEPVVIGKCLQPAASTAGQEVPLGDLLHLLLAEALDDRESQPPRLPVGRGLDRRDEGLLAGRPAPTLAARALATKVGVIDLDSAFELRLCRLARGHRPHQLVLYQPSRGLLDAQPATELDRADPALALRQVVDGANQVTSGSLVSWNTVPAVSRNCFLQRLH